MSILTLPVPWLVAQTATPPTDFVYQLGAFGVALVVAWWLLGRSDRQVENERSEAARDLEVAHLRLDREQAAHDETRRLLYDELRKRHNEGEAS